LRRLEKRVIHIIFIYIDTYWTSWPKC
jgi:hypothetical protein